MNPKPTTPNPRCPTGAAVFPLDIPPELGVQPLVLAVAHAFVFLYGSEDDVVNPAAAQEALEYMTDYLQRLDGPLLERLREDLLCLIAFARQEEEWPKQLVTTFLKTVSGRAWHRHFRLAGELLRAFSERLQNCSPAAERYRRG